MPLGGGAAASLTPTATTTSYAATAAADGTRLTISMPNFLAAETPVDGGGPTAQAHLDSSGVSAAFASAPYPGEAGANAPSLIAGFSGAPVPPYPLIASASYPGEPAKSVGAAGYQLDAVAAARRATATARAGGLSPTSTGSGSAATVQETDDGAVAATAVSDMTLAVVGGVTFHGVHSRAEVRMAKDRTVTRTTELRVGTITVAGSSAGFGPGRVTLGGSTIPTGPATEPFTKALAAAGFTLTVVQPEETGQSVLSPAIKLTRVQAVPGIDRTGTVTYLIGHTTAALSTKQAASSGEAHEAGPQLPALPELSAGDTGPSSQPATEPTTYPPGAHRPPTSRAPLPPSNRESPPLPRESVSADLSATGARPSAGALRVGAKVDFTSFYWVLMVAGALLLGCGEAVRVIGVRSR